MVGQWKRVSQVVDSLEAGRQAAARHAWRETYEAYAAADANDFTAGDLERLADAAWWTGRIEQAISLRERAYADFA